MTFRITAHPHARQHIADSLPQRDARHPAESLRRAPYVENAVVGKIANVRMRHVAAGQGSSPLPLDHVHDLPDTVAPSGSDVEDGMRSVVLERFLDGGAHVVHMNVVTHVFR